MNRQQQTADDDDDWINGTAKSHRKLPQAETLEGFSFKKAAQQHSMTDHWQQNVAGRSNSASGSTSFFCIPADFLSRDSDVTWPIYKPQTGTLEQMEYVFFGCQKA